MGILLKTFLFTQGVCGEGGMKTADNLNAKIKNIPSAPKQSFVQQLATKWLRHSTTHIFGLKTAYICRSIKFSFLGEEMRF